MPALGTFTLLAAFVTCAYAIAASVAGARRRSTRLVESGIGAYYFLAALMVVASALLIHAFVTGDYSIKYVQRNFRCRDAAGVQVRVVLGRARRLDHVLGVAARDFRIDRRLYQPRPPPRADSLRRLGARRHGDVLHLPDGDSQEPVLDVLDDAAS